MTFLKDALGILEASGTGVSSRYGHGPDAQADGKLGCPDCDFMGFLPDGPCPDCEDYSIKVQEHNLEVMKKRRSEKLNVQKQENLK